MARNGPAVRGHATYVADLRAPASANAHARALARARAWMRAPSMHASQRALARMCAIVQKNTPRQRPRNCERARAA
eukprot:6171861-Pleurochrysis_carterae.AAC.1